MDKKELSGLICTESITIIQAMEKIDTNAKGIVYVTDGEGKLTGSLSDGDIRRWILRTGKINSSISGAICRNVKSMSVSDDRKVEKFLEREKIRSVPIVNDKKEIVDVYFSRKDYVARSCERTCALKGTPVIIMAGGRGIRLNPYTKILPKPLIPVGEIPILERIMNRFYQFGVDEFYLTVNYKKEMIKSYFHDVSPEYRINYVEENEPLGTAGSISLIDRAFDRPVVVTNCDILIEADYGDVLKCHIDSGNDMTVVSSLKNTSIPYGVLHSREQGVITSMEEKPQITYLINTGMYVINPEFLKLIPKNKTYHMTDLAEQLIQDRKKVGMYPVSEQSFLDMGELEELKKMEERINSEQS